ncbi:MAG TPA: tetratricopeptide repeat protein [Actinomycetota bacterium]|nr:tetratricopeptide repeat protein [Actinomycetota bacterium]
MTSVLAGAVPPLSGSLRPRDPEAAITGDLGPGASAEAPDPLAFFEERVRRHPLDVAARLDLAHRYLDAARVGDAIDQYLEALRLDPTNVEAHAHMGLLLYLVGRPEDGLAGVQRALSADPAYPEALYIEGVILLGFEDQGGAGGGHGLLRLWSRLGKPGVAQFDKGQTIAGHHRHLALPATTCLHLASAPGSSRTESPGATGWSVPAEPLRRGVVGFVRLVRSDRVVRIMGARISGPEDFIHRYLTASLHLRTSRLVVDCQGSRLEMPLLLRP